MSSHMHLMELPRRVIVGRKILKNVGDSCKTLGLTRNALVLADPQTYKVAAKTVISSLNNVDINTDYVILRNPLTKQISKVEDKIKKFKPKVVLGVGGGRVIDVAKYISARREVPFISVPTAASHDGIASAQASLRGIEGMTSIRAQAPLAIIADTSVIVNSPYRLTASGCGDVISKYTAVRDWQLSHHLRNEYYGDYAADLALMSAKLVAKNSKIIRGGGEKGIRILVEALISCGVAMSIAGSSRPCSGSEHLFSHALDTLTPKNALHGEQCGVGTIMMAYLHKLNWMRIRRVLKRVGAPTNADELGIAPKYIVKALTKAHTIRPDRYTILGEKGLTEEAASRLAKSTGVIK
jgi:glycerol-1-phosphate dehydrogenase [NAD(P)+]